MLTIGFVIIFIIRTIKNKKKDLSLKSNAIISSMMIVDNKAFKNRTNMRKKEGGNKIYNSVYSISSTISRPQNNPH